MLKCRMLIKLITAQGVFYRTGDPYNPLMNIAGKDHITIQAANKQIVTTDLTPKDIAAGTDMVGYLFVKFDIFAAEHSAGVLSYPSLDVALFRIYGTNGDIDDPSTRWSFIEYKAKKSKRSNLSYAIIPATLTDADFPAITADSPRSEDIDAFGHALNMDPNRVIVSQPNMPRGIRGRSSLDIGNSADDSVLAFAANAKAISEGQFGQYPLYAFCKNSIWAMQVGDGDVAFSSVSPVSINTGIIGKHAFANIDAVIVYASQQGIKSIPESELPLSYPIQNSGDDRDILQKIDANTHMVHYYDMITGRSELWVSCQDKTFCYSLQYRRWFTMEETSGAYARLGKKTFRLDNGVLLHDSQTLPKKAGAFVTAPITMGEPDMLKRFRAIVAHYDTQTVPLLVNTTLYATPAAGENSGTVRAIDVEYELRYKHRTRIRSQSIDVKP